jgi:deferrochelatase/peroxidase EfeB
MTRHLDPSNLQSIVFRSHPCTHSHHLLLRSNDRAGARRFLAEWTPRVAHGGIRIDPANPPCPIINIAVSWAGLDKVGAFDNLGGVVEAAKAFPVDFMDPPDAISLRAYGPSAPENWWNKRFKSQDIDLTVHIYCMGQHQLDDATREVRKSARLHNFEELIPTKEEDGEAITGQVLGAGIPGFRKLHFGYSDGFSQPSVDDPAFAPGNSREVYPRGRFIIDEWDEKAQSFPRHEPWRGLVSQGSYLAFAWIYQDVAGFNRFLRDNAQKVAQPGMSQEEAEEFLAAKMMGRWRDGTPLVHSPDRPDEQHALKDFDYSQDEDGLRCPVAAHIRVVNGRDRPLNFANRKMFPNGFPRVLRRGSTYGPHLEGVEDDKKDRGIIGMFLCASINKQFYPLTRWIGTTNFSKDYADPMGQDPLFASRDVPGASHSFTIPTERGPVTLKAIPDFIRYQGVAILLLPSLKTLQRLSGSTD